MLKNFFLVVSVKSVFSREVSVLDSKYSFLLYCIPFHSILVAVMFKK